MNSTDRIQSLPAELLDEIVGLLKHSKHALLSLALGGKAFSGRARFHYVQQHSAELRLESYEEISTFSSLADSPHCTLLLPGYQNLTIRGFDTHLTTPLHSDSTTRYEPEIFSFLRNATIADSATIELPFVSLGCAPMMFPWDALSSWTSITSLKLAGTLPSVHTLASALKALQLLDFLELNCDYTDSTVPCLRGRLSPHLESLTVGPLGFAVFSWLAQLGRKDVYIESLVLEVGNDSTAPLIDFAARHGYAVEYLTVTLYREVIRHFLSSLRHFTGVLEFEFYLKLTPMGGYSHLIGDIASSITPSYLDNLAIYVPELLGSESAAGLTRLAQAHLADVGGHDLSGCVSIYSRSWMQACGTS